MILEDLYLKYIPLVEKCRTKTELAEILCCYIDDIFNATDEQNIDINYYINKFITIKGEEK